MTVTPVTAANAYAAAARALDGPSQPQAGKTIEPGAFATLVDAAMTGVADSGRAVEAKAADLAAGQADIVDLVTAVAETELAVETLVTVRDRVISAYQEILNMPI